MKLLALASDINNVGDLIKMLQTIPADTEINPVGMEPYYVYSEKDEMLYVDEVFDWIEDEQECEDLYEQIKEREGKIWAT